MPWLSRAQRLDSFGHALDDGSGGTQSVVDRGDLSLAYMLTLLEEPPNQMYQDRATNLIHNSKPNWTSVSSTMDSSVPFLLGGFGGACFVESRNIEETNSKGTHKFRGCSPRRTRKGSFSEENASLLKEAEGEPEPGCMNGSSASSFGPVGRICSDDCRDGFAVPTCRKNPKTPFG